MPFNIQQELPACARDYQVIVPSILVLNLEEYHNAETHTHTQIQTHTHTEKVGASNQSQYIDFFNS